MSKPTKLGGDIPSTVLSGQPRLVRELTKGGPVLVRVNQKPTMVVLSVESWNWLRKMWPTLPEIPEGRAPSPYGR